MTALEFSRLRTKVKRSQKELASILGVSLKAVESYEQGWRPVPVAVERTLYYLAFRLAGIGHQSEDQDLACWNRLHCAETRRAACPAWQAGEGRFCWFLTGNLCAAAGSGTSGNSAGQETLPGQDQSESFLCHSCPVFLDGKSRLGLA